jgi:hypothetical protein
VLDCPSASLAVTTGGQQPKGGRRSQTQRVDQLVPAPVGCAPVGSSEENVGDEVELKPRLVSRDDLLGGGRDLRDMVENPKRQDG